jgi:hypothetical protein
MDMDEEKNNALDNQAIDLKTDTLRDNEGS